MNNVWRTHYKGLGQYLVQRLKLKIEFNLETYREYTVKFIICALFLTKISINCTSCSTS